MSQVVAMKGIIQFCCNTDMKNRLYGNKYPVLKILQTKKNVQLKYIWFLIYHLEYTFLLIFYSLCMFS